MNKGAWRVCLFLLLTAAVLVGLGELPRWSLWGYEAKRISVIDKLLPKPSPPQEEEEEEEKEQQEELTMADSLAVDSLGEQPLSLAFLDTVAPPPDVVLIEDVPDSVEGGMSLFYKSLAAREHLGRPVRIAFYGDSFIEGDILTGDLRELLQREYGGNGVGYVDIASPCTQYKATIRCSGTGWTDHSILESSRENRSLAGISGRCAISGASGASVTFTGSQNFFHLSPADRAFLYVSAADTQELIVRTGSDTLDFSLCGNGEVEALPVNQRITTLTLSTCQAGLTAYGIALEGRSGIVLDNFSLRGCSGAPLASIPTQRLLQFAKLRPYDLIVLQFGLNIAEKDRLNYDAYMEQMKRVISHLRSAYPRAAILIVSVGDRNDRIDGELQTMPGVKALVKAQQRLATESGAAFWNLFAAMGGDLSIARMAESSPSEAGKDYTHINIRGGRRLAQSLFKAIQFGYGHYQRKTTFYEEK